MNTLAEVEVVIPKLSAEELVELEKFVRNARLTKTKAGGRSALDLPPLDLGRMVKPLGSRAEWYDEMLEGRVHPKYTQGRIAPSNNARISI